LLRKHVLYRIKFLCFVMVGYECIPLNDNIIVMMMMMMMMMIIIIIIIIIIMPYDKFPFLGYLS